MDDFQRMEIAEFGSLPLSKKINLASSLASGHRPSVFFSILISYLVLFSICGLLSTVFDFSALLPFGANLQVTTAASTVGAVFGLALGTVIWVFLFSFFAVGICALVLHHLKGQKVENTVGLLLSPWSRFSTLIISVGIWAGLFLIVGVVASMFIRIPFFIGWFLVYLIECALISALICACNFMAEDDFAAPLDAALIPLQVIREHLSGWLSVAFLYALANLPGMVIFALAVFLAPYSGIASMLVSLMAAVYFAFVAVFCFFFAALTYLQSKEENT